MTLQQESGALAKEDVSGPYKAISVKFMQSHLTESALLQAVWILAFVFGTLRMGKFRSKKMYLEESD